MINLIKNIWNSYLTAKSAVTAPEDGIEGWTSVVHVGAGKCGSSSLQAALCNQPAFSSNSLKRTFKYFAIQPKITLGPAQIKQRMPWRPNGIPSHSFKRVFYSDETGKPVKNEARIAEVRDHLNSQIASGVTPIISSESLVNNLKRPTHQKLFEELELSALVCLYIRPQVELINSSWWQWGVWGDASFSDWLNDHQYVGRWNQHIKNLRGMSFVRRLHVGAVSNDVVSDFFHNIAAPVPSETINPRVNKSLGIDAISFLIRNRRYRPEPHAPLADSILEHFPSQEKPRSAWCLNPEQIESVLEVHRNGNKELLDLLPKPLSDQILKNEKWWSADAYSDRQVWDWQNLTVNDRTSQLDKEMKDYLEANGMK